MAARGTSRPPRLSFAVFVVRAITWDGLVDLLLGDNGGADPMDR